MGVAAPAPTVTTHLAVIPLASLLPVRAWSNADSIHKAVMSLFPDGLARTDTRGVASMNGILYRLDAQPSGHTVVVVQSRIPFDHLPRGARSGSIDLSLEIPAGARVRFQVALNPTRRAKTPPNSHSSRHKPLRAVPDHDAEQWAITKLAPALSDVNIWFRRRDSYRRKGAELVIDNIAGEATVADPAALNTFLTEGIGRSRAWGAGLLTLAPLG